ncbi:unnamed protein product, partial [Mesorhabditis spiculigera]
MVLLPITAVLTYLNAHRFHNLMMDSGLVPGRFFDVKRDLPPAGTTGIEADFVEHSNVNLPDISRTRLAALSVELEKSHSWASDQLSTERTQPTKSFDIHIVELERQSELHVAEIKFRQPASSWKSISDWICENTREIYGDVFHLVMPVNSVSEIFGHQMETLANRPGTSNLDLTIAKPIISRFGQIGLVNYHIKLQRTISYSVPIIEGQLRISSFAVEAPDLFSVTRAVERIS